MATPEQEVIGGACPGAFASFFCILPGKISQFRLDFAEAGGGSQPTKPFFSQPVARSQTVDFQGLLKSSEGQYWLQA